MQALDSFISPIPCFEGDIPISAIPILAHPHGGESINDSSTGASASTLKTRAGKRKAITYLTPQKKTKKATGKSSGRIKINKPLPKALASNPPSGPRQSIPIHLSKRYAYRKRFPFLPTL
jgi:hypothetical protein